MAVLSSSGVNKTDLAPDGEATAIPDSNHAYPDLIYPDDSTEGASPTPLTTGTVIKASLTAT